MGHQAPTNIQHRMSSPQPTILFVNQSNPALIQTASILLQKIGSRARVNGMFAATDQQCLEMTPNHHAATIYVRHLATAVGKAPGLGQSHVLEVGEQKAMALGNCVKIRLSTGQIDADLKNIYVKMELFFI